MEISGVRWKFWAGEEVEILGDLPAAGGNFANFEVEITKNEVNSGKTLGSKRLENLEKQMKNMKSA